MAINQNRYVNITSGVVGSSSVAARQLIPRIFTTNSMVGTGAGITFYDAASVGAFFGTSSEEYLRALFMFTWTAKNINKASAISFAKYSPSGDTPAIYGKAITQSIAAWQAITNGDMTLSIGAVSHHFTGLNFSTDTTLTQVATTLQSALSATFTGCTVTWNATAGAFDFADTTLTGANVVTVTAGTTNDITGLLGWTSGASIVNGCAAQTITQCLSNSASASNNFGSFAFTNSCALTLQNVTDAANWNATQNVMYQYHVGVSAANSSTWSAALFGIEGVGLSLSPLSTEFPEMVPMLIMAATDYTSANTSQAYMYQQFNLTPSVLTDADANTYDALRVNYYGQTQTAGQNLSFYQRGILMGGNTAPVWMGDYSNEQWLKSSIAANVLNLFLAVLKVPANPLGEAQLINATLPTINQALSNGTISVGNALTATQIASIAELSNTSTAYHQVQSAGYWMDWSFKSNVNPNNGITEYEADYILIYKKDDDVLKVNGTHALV